MTKTFVTKSAEETEALGAKLSALLVRGDCVAFFGGLGMGKTAFVRGMANGMGLEAHVSSPIAEMNRQAIMPTATAIIITIASREMNSSFSRLCIVALKTDIMPKTEVSIQKSIIHKSVSLRNLPKFFNVSPPFKVFMLILYYISKKNTSRYFLFLQLCDIMLI